MTNTQMVFLPHNLKIFWNRKRTAEVLKLRPLDMVAMIETYALEFFAQK
jgi:hypothetical protein